MEHRILFLGNNQKSSQFVQQVLDKNHYNLCFHPINEFKSNSSQLGNIDLIIVDTVPLSKENLHFVYSLKKEPSVSQIPILALVDEQPPRLRYRLVEMGVDDYQTVPFDKLDFQIKIKNLVGRNNHQSLVRESQVPAGILKLISQLLRNFDLPLLSFDSKKLLTNLLRALNKACDSQQVLLFEIEQKNSMRLKYFSPDNFIDTLLQLNISDFPILEKSMNAKKPILLNTAVNPNSRLITHLNSQLNVQISSIIIYPLTVSGKVNSVLMVWRTNQVSFNKENYQTVQIFSELIGHAIYINEIKLIEKKQLDREAWQFYYDFQERIVNKLDFGILVLDNQGTVKFLNEKAAQVFRIPKEDILHNPLNAILSEDEVSAMLTFKEKDINTLERPELMIEVGKKERILLGFSVYCFVDDRTTEEGYIISLKDITARKELQDEKDRNERLESLGLMATGIAHEIRNPLAGIKAIAQTLEEELDGEDSRGEYVKRIVRQVNRLDDLLKTLYQFAKPAKPNPSFCSIEDILREVVRAFQENLHSKNIQLIETLHSNLPEVYVDDQQIYQVIYNLIKNSIQATGSDGEIRVIVKSLENGQLISKKHLKSLIQGKPYIEVHIQDTGHGIPPTNLDRIFNPYFTTKLSSAGLGLSIVYQTVKQNGGLIYFDRTEQGGTDCTLILPASN